MKNVDFLLVSWRQGCDYWNALLNSFGGINNNRYFVCFCFDVRTMSPNNSTETPENDGAKIHWAIAYNPLKPLQSNIKFYLFIYYLVYLIGTH